MKDPRPVIARSLLISTAPIQERVNYVQSLTSRPLLFQFHARLEDCRKISPRGPPKTVIRPAIMPLLKSAEQPLQWDCKSVIIINFRRRNGRATAARIDDNSRVPRAVCKESRCSWTRRGTVVGFSAVNFSLSPNRRLGERAARDTRYQFLRKDDSRRPNP